MNHVLDLISSPDTLYAEGSSEAAAYERTGLSPSESSWQAVGGAGLYSCSIGE